MAKRKMVEAERCAGCVGLASGASPQGPCNDVADRCPSASPLDTNLLPAHVEACMRCNRLRADGCLNFASPSFSKVRPSARQVDVRHLLLPISTLSYVLTLCRILPCVSTLGHVCNTNAPVSKKNFLGATTLSCDAAVMLRCRCASPCYCPRCPCRDLLRVLLRVGAECRRCRRWAKWGVQVAARHAKFALPIRDSRLNRPQEVQRASCFSLSNTP